MTPRRSITIAPLIMAVALVAGCATVTDVVPNEEITLVAGNVYETLDVDHRGVFGSEDSLKKNVFDRVEKFAAEKGKAASPLTARIHRVGVLADWAWFYLKFELVEPGSPCNPLVFPDHLEVEG